MYFLSRCYPDSWPRTPTLCAVKRMLPGISAMPVLPQRGGAMSSVSMDFRTGATLVQRLVQEFLCRMLFNTACLILNIIRLLFKFSTLKKPELLIMFRKLLLFVCVSAKFLRVPHDALIIQDFITQFHCTTQ